MLEITQFEQKEPWDDFTPSHASTTIVSALEHDRTDVTRQRNHMYDATYVLTCQWL